MEHSTNVRSHRNTLDTCIHIRKYFYDLRNLKDDRSNVPRLRKFPKMKERKKQRWGNSSLWCVTAPRAVSFSRRLCLHDTVLVRRRVSPPSFHVKITRLQPDTVCIMTYLHSNFYSVLPFFEALRVSTIVDRRNYAPARQFYPFIFSL